MMGSSIRSSQDDSAPLLDVKTDSFAKVVESRGKGQFLVSLPDSTEILVYMPPKFRNALWIRRGSFIIIRRYSEEGSEILHVLSGDQIKEIKRDGKWPSEYQNPIEPEEEEDEKEECEYEDVEEE